VKESGKKKKVYTEKPATEKELGTRDALRGEGGNLYGEQVGEGGLKLREGGGGAPKKVASDVGSLDEGEK